MKLVKGCGWSGALFNSNKKAWFEAEEDFIKSFEKYPRYKFYGFVKNDNDDAYYVVYRYVPDGRLRWSIVSHETSGLNLPFNQSVKIMTSRLSRKNVLTSKHSMFHAIPSSQIESRPIPVLPISGNFARGLWGLLLRV